MDRIKLILLCGIPGSGKTTYVQRRIKQHGGIHLSSDLIRKELYGDESIQGNPSEVFSLMQSRAIETLNNGETIYYDATNITRKDRDSIISICPKFAQIECHVVWAPIETCIERDITRERTVGQAVINRMLKRFQPPFYDEGIDEIKIISPDDFSSVKYSGKIMDEMNIPHDNPHHSLGIKEHCIEAYINACNMGINSEFELAAMWHDIGKPYVKAFTDSKGNPCETAHYYSHQCVSAWISYGMPNITPFVVWLIGAHMEPFANSKYYNKLPPFLKKQVNLLHECDVNAH